MSLIGLLVGVLVLCLVYWAIHKLAATFGLAPQIVVVLDIILVLVACLWLVGLAGYGPGLRIR